MCNNNQKRGPVGAHQRSTRWAIFKAKTIALPLYQPQGHASRCAMPIKMITGRPTNNRAIMPPMIMPLISATAIVLWLALLGLNTTAHALTAIPRMGAQITAPLQSALRLPTILNAEDQRLYQQSFQLVRDKKFAAAKDNLVLIHNPILRGTLLAQIYLHPNYTSNIDELRLWLRQYPGDGAATQIFALAKHKMPRRKVDLTQPSNAPLPPEAMDPDSKQEWLASKNNNDTTTNNEFAASRIEDQVRQARLFVRRDRLFEALSMARKKSTPEQIAAYPQLVDRLYAVSTAGFYMAERYQDAVSIASECVKLLADRAIECSWWGGLSAWQTSSYKQAHDFFIYASGSTDPFLQSGGYFWQARALETLDDHDAAIRAAINASKNSTTFYGQLALKYLHPERPIGAADIFIDNPISNERVLYRMAQIPVIARGFALLAIGEDNLAMLEWQPVLNKLNLSYSENLLAVATSYRMEHTSLRLAMHLEKLSGRFYGRALFPILDDQGQNLQPSDHALALAVARQESHFFPYAISGSGAVGLMQMMPATALMVSRKSEFSDLSPLYNGKSPSRYDLMNPAVNFVMGTRYLQSLLRDNGVDGNLIFALASYNAGISNIRKWAKKKNIHHNDPLLFIESMPIRETRLYVARVMANYWVYSELLGTENPSLTQVVNNKWPIY